MKKELVYDEEGRIYLKTSKGFEKLSLFTDRYYSLRVFNGIPILEIDGVRMHLVKNFKTPLEYASVVCKMLKIGKNDAVLDTCGGLGYTAIEASKKAKKIISVEKSYEVLELAKQNPYSKEYFKNKKIKRINNDIEDAIKKFKDKSFDRIIHDPPRKNFAPYLYSTKFYEELIRVLKPNGLLYHYVGAVGKRRKKSIEREIGDRLSSIPGFKTLKYDKKCYGWLVKKT